MINKEHPEYYKYKQECDELREDYVKKQNSILENSNQLHGKDGELDVLWKKFALDLKAIQKRYSHLRK